MTHTIQGGNRPVINYFLFPNCSYRVDLMDITLIEVHRIDRSCDSLIIINLLLHNVKVENFNKVFPKFGKFGVKICSHTEYRSIEEYNICHFRDICLRIKFDSHNPHKAQGLNFAKLLEKKVFCDSGPTGLFWLLART